MIFEQTHTTKQTFNESVLLLVKISQILVSYVIKRAGQWTALIRQMISRFRMHPNLIGTTQLALKGDKWIFMK